MDVILLTVLAQLKFPLMWQTMWQLVQVLPDMPEESPVRCVEILKL